jgi:hypothetical protein
MYLRILGVAALAFGFIILALALAFPSADQASPRVIEIVGLGVGIVGLLITLGRGIYAIWARRAHTASTPRQ